MPPSSAQVSFTVDADIPLAERLVIGEGVVPGAAGVSLASAQSAISPAVVPLESTTRRSVLWPATLRLTPRVGVRPAIFPLLYATLPSRRTRNVTPPAAPTASSIPTFALNVLNLPARSYVRSLFDQTP